MSDSGESVQGSAAPANHSTAYMNDSDEVLPVPPNSEQEQQLSSDSNDSDPSCPSNFPDSGGPSPVKGPFVNSSNDGGSELNTTDSDPENVQRDESVPESQNGLDSEDVQIALDEHVGLSRDFVVDVHPHVQDTRNAAEIAADIVESGAVNDKGGPFIKSKVVEQLRENLQQTEEIANRLESAVEPATKIIENTKAVGLMTPERDMIQKWSSNQQSTLQTAERIAQNSREVLHNVLSGNPNGVQRPRTTGNPAITAWLNECLSSGYSDPNTNNNNDNYSSSSSDSSSTDPVVNHPVDSNDEGSGSAV